MKKTLSTLLLVTIVLFAMFAIAADKVVVIPLGGAKNYMYWQGDWAGGTDYVVGDAVHRDGSSYLCLVKHKSVDFISDAANWELFAAKGSVGVAPDQICTGQSTMIGIDASGNIICSAKEKKVFVSSSAYNGNLGGLTGADAKCNTLAAAAGLSGSFKAWLSDNTGSPSTRFTQSTYPYVLVDGTVIANDWEDLVDGVEYNRISLHEDNTAVSVSVRVWTHTEEDGSTFEYVPNYYDDCGDWRSNSESDEGTRGNPNRSTANNSGEWTFYGWATCNNFEHILCFEQ